MNPWPFVTAAYAVTLLATGLLLVFCWQAMRAAERQAQALRDDRR